MFDIPGYIFKAEVVEIEVTIILIEYAKVVIKGLLVDVE